MDFAKFLQPPPAKVQAVDMPEWGGKLYVRQLNAKEVSEHIKVIKDRDGVYTNADLVVRAACNEKGEAVFKADDLERVLAWPMKALGRVAREAFKLSMSGNVEDTEKNSEATASGDSGSA